MFGVFVTKDSDLAYVGGYIARGLQERRTDVAYYLDPRGTAWQEWHMEDTRLDHAFHGIGRVEAWHAEALVEYAADFAVVTLSPSGLPNVELYTLLDAENRRIPVFGLDIGTTGRDTDTWKRQWSRVGNVFDHIFSLELRAVVDEDFPRQATIVAGEIRRRMRGVALARN